ncbi:peptidoglycan DD-metalloendopeptidase family protein [Streptomyces sp. SID13666]|uniref:murein hydrolase activator EnvC family protein n=1 Tax=unclassified Streptomyces TaxID=2593676 RepID=UPI0013C1FA19|nr:MULTISPECIES: M23 family metallopeptidase [unclassified Streptomyces]NEA59223.1 peptidoglycan DD-metalloendopeptidase family protein [Streptomyces sp. SID13666]NEA74166.1 peptidoglycan DD-metalloendopeptidase family protein [Streptomyces sp. SID13588]
MPGTASVRGSAVRSLAVLLCAGLLTALPVLPVLPLLPDPAHGSLGGRQARADDRLGDVSAEVDTMYRQAADATTAYDKARRAADKQRATAVRLRRSVTLGQRKMDGLHESIGLLARLQYRSGGLPAAAALMLSDSPEELLDRMGRLRKSDEAVTALLSTVATTTAHLRRDRTAADRALGELDEQTAREAGLQKEITAKLARARELLRRLEAARSARLASPQECAHAIPEEMPSPGTAIRVRAPWIAPVDHYTLSAGFDAPGDHWANRHTGQDFAVPEGTPVRAVGAGTVVRTTCGDGFGNQIVLRHGNGYFSQYAHLSLMQVKVGERVLTGRQIALSGSTGNSTGPHLHFEVRVTPELGSGVDPVPWLREHGVRLQSVAAPSTAPAVTQLPTAPAITLAPPAPAVTSPSTPPVATVPPVSTIPTTPAH